MIDDHKTSAALEPTDQANSAQPKIEPRPIFISHHSKEKANTEIVRQWLETHGSRTFVSYVNIIPGRQWYTALEENIDNCSATVVLIGKDGIGHWQQKEIALAFEKEGRDLEKGIQFPIIPVLLPGAETDKAPTFLLLNQAVDLRQGITETGLQQLGLALKGYGSTI
jgi:hypothetical protein